jgi:CHAT domain-containing protein/Tfp pilus assembly protein PilF
MKPSPDSIRRPPWWRLSAILVALPLLCGCAPRNEERPPAAAPAASLAELLEQGRRLLDAGENQRAWETYQRAKTLAEKAGDRTGEIAALTGMGDADPPRTDGKAAVDAFEQALALVRGTQADAIRAHLELRKGFRALSQNDISQAETRLNSALSAARRSGDRRMEAASLHGLGHVAWRRSDFSLAGERYRAALSLATTAGDRFVMARAEHGIGNAESDLGRREEALRHFQAALALNRAISNRRLTEGTLNAIGSVHIDQNDYGKALHYLQEALRTGTDDLRERGYLLNNLGIVAGQANADLGASYFQRCLRIARQEGDDYLAMRTLNNLGTLAQRGGQAARSREYFQQALQLAEKVGDRQAAAGDWYNLGDAYEREDRLDLARHGFERSLAIARELGDNALVGQALGGLADLHVLKRDFATAVELAGRATAKALEAGDRQTLWTTRTIAGVALQALGRPAAARRAYGDAIATVEEVRDLGAGPVGRDGYLESRIEPYQRMIVLAADQGEGSEALRHAELAKGRTLTDVLREGRAAPAVSLTPEEQAAEQRLRDRLSALNGEILRAHSRGRVAAELERRREQSRRDLEALTLNLQGARSGLRRGDLPAWTPAAARPLLAGGSTALLEYAVLEDRAYLWTVTAASAASPPEIRLHRLAVGSAELTSRVEAFRRQLAARDLDFQRSARGLYDLLLAPAASELQGKKSLCIVPDGPLWDLPFQTLQTEDSEVLLERHALFYAPSLAFLAATAARRTPSPSPPTLLAVGNPALAAETVGFVAPLRGGLARLPEAEREVQALARLYGPSRSAVYTGLQASEERVKAEAGKFRVLHFATHAFLDDRTPLYSSLLLAQGRPGRREDGLLEAWEILGLRLDADLVVLSACQTARGRPRAGEGMVGLSWALAAAGSAATLASQWEVDSASASELMVAFHREWLGGASKAEALRRAALAVRRQERYRHPFYWAPFVLVGAGD